MNNCTLPAGMRQITGEVFINGRRFLPDQLKGTHGVLVENDASISTRSAGSTVFLLVEMHFLSGETTDWNLTLHLTGNKTKFPDSVSDQELYFQFLQGKSVH